MTIPFAEIEAARGSLLYITADNPDRSIASAREAIRAAYRSVTDQRLLGWHGEFISYADSLQEAYATKAPAFVTDAMKEHCLVAIDQIEAGLRMQDA